MNVVGLSGSPSAQSRSAWLLQFAQTRLNAQRRGDAATIALREMPAQALVHGDAQHPALREAIGRIARAEVVLVATPIYKAAYSGLLKIFLDLLPSDILRGKSVLPLATGGSPGHLLAIDYALKPVLGALGARHIVDAVYVLDEQLVPHETHGYVPDDAIVERLDRALQGLADTPPRRVSPIAPPLRESPTLVARFHS